MAMLPLRSHEVVGEVDQNALGVMLASEGLVVRAAEQSSLLHELDAPDESFFFFFIVPAPTEISPLPLHAALPICATMSSQPPICSPSIKICGTVVRPPARRIISSRRPGCSIRSISVN